MPSPTERPVPLAPSIAGGEQEPAAAPILTALAHLHLLGVAAALLLKRYIVAHGDRLVGQDGRLDDTLVSLNEALAFFGHRLRELPVASDASARERTTDGLDADFDRTMRVLRARELASEAEGIPLPLLELKRHFELTDDEHLVLSLLAAFDVDVGLNRVARLAMADSRARGLLVGFVHELAARDGVAFDRLWAVWRDDGGLRRHGLIHIEGPLADPIGLFERRVWLWPRLASWLRGEADAMDERATSWLSRRRATISPSDLCLGAGVHRRLVALLRRTGEGGGPRIALVGPAGAGKRTLVAALANSRGTHALLLDGATFARAAQPDLFGLAVAEAALSYSPLCVDLTGLDESHEGLWRETLRRAADRLARHPLPIFVTVERVPPWLHASGAGLVELALTAPEPARLVELWRKELSALGPGHDLDVAQLSATYRLTPGGIVKAVADIGQAAGVYRALSDGAGRLEEAAWRAARRQLNHRLGALAEPIRTELTLADVVLHPEIRARIDQILVYARRQGEVFEEWGFALRLTYGRGLPVLFSGPPGTGKTLVSGIIARELGRELYRVDTSRIVDKYIGETEKNLARIFDEAERAQAILLFDEADSLFATRTTVTSSNDRYANLNVNYLLQRMEDYSGMSILTTNFESSIDEAFKRRLRFSVRFPEPSADERAALWRALIPEQARRRVASDVDFGALAATFDFTGGYIKNAVLRAAMSAAERDGVLTQDDLHRAGASVYAELGKIAPPMKRSTPRA